MRVMRVLTRPNLGGPTLQAVALWHAHAAMGVSTLLVVGRCRDDETVVDLSGRGIPRLALSDVDASAAGFVELPQLDNRWSPAGANAASRGLRQLLRAFQPDVVHTHTSKAGWLARRVARTAGAPVVAHTFHGHVLRDYFGPLRSWLMRRLETRLARRTDLLVTVSESCADELASLGVAPRQRLVVIPPAVAAAESTDRRTARRAMGVAADSWLVACIGRLVEVKRVDRFIAALAALPDAHGHIIGDGPLAGRLRASLPAHGRIELHAADPLIRRHLAAYDALVIPSAREGCPLVAVEAFAADVPVVGFDVPGVRDVLQNWGSGVLVPEQQGPAGLAGGLARLRADGALRQRCITVARRGLSRFAAEQVATELIQAYRTAQGAPVRYAVSPRC